MNLPSLFITFRTSFGPSKHTDCVGVSNLKNLTRLTKLCFRKLTYRHNDSESGATVS